MAKTDGRASRIHDRLVEIRDGILESRKNALRRQIVMTLYDSGEPFDRDVIDALFNQQWEEPSSQELGALVAAKVHAAAAHSAAQLDAARAADRNSREKVGKFRALLERVEADAADTTSVEAAEAELAEFEEMAAAVAGVSVAAGPVHSALAGTAEGSSEVGI
jgi:hypothetical protein